MRRFARFKEMKALGYFNDRTAAARAIERGFPAPFELGPNTLAWDLDEVEAYIATRPRRVPKTGAKASAPSAKRGPPGQPRASRIDAPISDASP
jgi:predicted DNA-binding transcriptional regulator AlpA